MEDSLCLKNKILNSKNHAISFKVFWHHWRRNLPHSSLQLLWDTFISFKRVTSEITTIFFRSEAEALSRELNMRLYRTSVKDDLNVSVVFQHLAENYVNKVSVMPPSQLRFQFHFFCQIILDQKCFHRRRRPNRICIRFSSWHIGTTGAGGRFRWNRVSLLSKLIRKLRSNFKVTSWLKLWCS